MREKNDAGHGGDTYDTGGRLSGFLDFSTTAQPASPRGWRSRASAALRVLPHYPQPYSSGLSAFIEKQYGLPRGSVLAGNGTSDCMSWAAAWPAPGGRKKVAAVLERPCFSEYEKVLEGAGVPVRPTLPRGTRLHSFWAANPATPTGLIRPASFWAAVQVRLAREAPGALFVLDESLAAQSLRPFDSFLKQACRRPDCVVLRSPAKALGLPGLRLGFMAGHPRTLALLSKSRQPWSVNGLAQALGPWMVSRECESRESFQRERSRATQDLRRRLRESPLLGTWLKPLDSSCGFFLCQLRGITGLGLARRLRAQGLLVRPCASFGAWGREFIRLNARKPLENARLVKALEKVKS